MLVNAAGVVQTGPLTHMNHQSVRYTIQTNLMGTLWACQYVPRGMLERRRERADEGSSLGCIINISSLLATHGGKGASVYAASKAAVLSKAPSRPVGWPEQLSL